MDFVIGDRCGICKVEIPCYNTVMRHGYHNIHVDKKEDSDNSRLKIKGTFAVSDFHFLDHYIRNSPLLPNILCSITYSITESEMAMAGFLLQWFPQTVNATILVVGDGSNHVVSTVLAISRPTSQVISVDPEINTTVNSELPNLTLVDQKICDFLKTTKIDLTKGPLQVVLPFSHANFKHMIKSLHLNNLLKDIQIVAFLCRERHQTYDDDYVESFSLQSESILSCNFLFPNNFDTFLVCSENYVFPDGRIFMPKKYKTYELELPLLNRVKKSIFVNYNITFQIEALAQPNFSQFFNLFQFISKYMTCLIWQTLDIGLISLWTTLFNQVDDEIKKQRLLSIFPKIVTDDWRFGFLLSHFLDDIVYVYPEQNPNLDTDKGVQFLTKDVIKELTDEKFIVVQLNKACKNPVYSNTVKLIVRTLDFLEVIDQKYRFEHEKIHCILDPNRNLYFCTPI
jgi:hypothetical protein